MIFIVVAVVFSYVVYAYNIRMKTMIVFTGGAFVTFGNIIFPIWVHLKCVLYDRSSGEIEG